MTLILIHGNSLLGIFNKLAQIKKSFNKFSISELDYKDLGSRVSFDFNTPQLFAEQRLVIIGNIENDFNFELLPKDNPEITVVVFITKLLPSSSKILKQAMALKAEIIPINEKEDSSIFPFLDKLAEKNPSSLVDFEKLYKNYGSQYLLTMIFYMFRRFILIPKNLPPFVITKLKKQKNNFTEDKIKNLYYQSLELDFKIKNGLVEEKTGFTLLIQNIIS